MIKQSKFRTSYCKDVENCIICKLIKLYNEYINQNINVGSLDAVTKPIYELMEHKKGDQDDTSDFLFKFIDLAESNYHGNEFISLFSGIQKATHNRYKIFNIINTFSTHSDNGFRYYIENDQEDLKDPIELPKFIIFTFVKNNKFDVPEIFTLKDKNYKLFGTINHLGGDRGGGHFIANVRSGDTWSCANDNYTKEITLDGVQKSNPMMTIYEKTAIETKSNPQFPNNAQLITQYINECNQIGNLFEIIIKKGDKLKVYNLMSSIIAEVFQVCVNKSKEIDQDQAQRDYKPDSLPQFMISDNTLDKIVRSLGTFDTFDNTRPIIENLLIVLWGLAISKAQFEVETPKIGSKFDADWMAHVNIGLIDIDEIQNKIITVYHPALKLNKISCSPAKVTAVNTTGPEGEDSTLEFPSEKLIINGYKTITNSKISSLFHNLHGDRKIKAYNKMTELINDVFQSCVESSSKIDKEKARKSYKTNDLPPGKLTPGNLSIKFMNLIPEVNKNMITAIFENILNVSWCLSINKDPFELRVPKIGSPFDKEQMSIESSIAREADFAKPITAVGCPSLWLRDKCVFKAIVLNI